ncbi:MAG: hypothetical protein JOY93_01420 [Acidobacteriales bacterium]|nr:hypothetical protein [Terriglobales bacterium]
MSDPLYLSLWFANFELAEMLPRALGVIRQVPLSAQRPGIVEVALHPVSWNEPTILEQRFNPGISPEQAVLIAADFLHEDNAYVFQGFWDLWSPSEDGSAWALQPAPIAFMVHGIEFDDGVYEQAGHIKVDFGLDSLFLQDAVRLTPDAEARVKANVEKLVEFTTKVEKNSGANARLLWSESEESLAQKLIARLQKVQ